MNEPVNLPKTYQMSRLVCLVKDPNWLFAFWEVLDEQVQQAYQTLSPLPGSLQLLVNKKEAGRWHTIRQIPVNSTAGSWYIDVPETGKEYQLQLAVGQAENKVVLLTSNSVETPSGGISEQEDEVWATIDQLYAAATSTRETRGISFSPGLWNISSVTSPFGHREHKPTGFEVHTDLIVHGKIQPGHRLFIQGEAVPVQPDGSFSIRCSLPDGVFVYPVRVEDSAGTVVGSTVPVITRETY